MRSPPLRCTVLLVASLTAACGSDPDDGWDYGSDEPEEEPRPKTCAKPKGFYEVTFVQRTGSCGPQSGFTADLAQPNFATGTVGGTCKGSGTARDQNCTYEATATCPGKLTAQQMLACEIKGGCTATPLQTHRTHTEWDPSLDFATGIWSMVTDGGDVGVSCSSTYDVTFTRL